MAEYSSSSIPQGSKNARVMEAVKNQYALASAQQLLQVRSSYWEGSEFCIMLSFSFALARKYPRNVSRNV